MRPLSAVLLTFLLAGRALAQQAPAPDPELLAVKLDGCVNLMDARERQIVAMTRQLQSERAYWAAYVAGLSPPLAEKTP